MRLYLDCEFDGFGGDLISIALTGADGREFYWARDDAGVRTRDKWVRENVLPILDVEGAKPSLTGDFKPKLEMATALQVFLQPYAEVEVIADWPEDIRHFCDLMITGPGERIDTPPISFEIVRIDAYPTTLPGAVQHNALWDARAIKHAMTATTV